MFPRDDYDVEIGDRVTATRDIAVYRLDRLDMMTLILAGYIMFGNRGTIQGRPFSLGDKGRHPDMKYIWIAWDGPSTTATKRCLMVEYPGENDWRKLNVLEQLSEV